MSFLDTTFLQARELVDINRIEYIREYIRECKLKSNCISMKQYNSWSNLWKCLSFPTHKGKSIKMFNYLFIQGFPKRQVLKRLHFSRTIYFNALFDENIYVEKSNIDNKTVWNIFIQNKVSTVNEKWSIISITVNLWEPGQVA